MKQRDCTKNNISDIPSPILPSTPRTSRNMILRNSTPSSSPRKVKILLMDSPRKCNSRNCKNFAYRLIEDRDKSGISNYYCEKCIENICMVNPKELKITQYNTPSKKIDFENTDFSSLSSL